MKLITNQTDLETEFKRLSSQYKTFYWSTAWAGINSKAFDDLKRNEVKINQVVVGIHFYQTHPDFIETFLTNKNVRYILQPSGTFHPKIYLFVNNESNWEIIVGSANFTNAAFNINKEASILLSNKDNNSNEIYHDAKHFIEESWEAAKTFDEKELEKYRITWNNHQLKINSLSGRYGSKKANTKTNS